MFEWVVYRNTSSCVVRAEGSAAHHAECRRLSFFSRTECQRPSLRRVSETLCVQCRGLIYNIQLTWRCTSTCRLSTAHKQLRKNHEQERTSCSSDEYVHWAQQYADLMPANYNSEYHYQCFWSSA